MTVFLSSLQSLCVYLCRPMMWRRTATSSTRRWLTEPTLWLWVGSEPASDRSPLSEETAHCRSTFFFGAVKYVSTFTTVMFRSYLWLYLHLTTLSTAGYVTVSPEGIREKHRRCRICTFQFRSGRFMLGIDSWPLYKFGPCIFLCLFKFQRPNF
jgi:hypothetical protein